MRIVILCVGTLGEVVPYTDVATELRASGHDVAIAAEEKFRDLVTGFGFEFRPLRIDMRSLLTTAAARAIETDHSRAGQARAQLKWARNAGDTMLELGESVVSAAKDAELLLPSVGANLHGYLVAKAMGVPSMGLYVWPMTPTREFPPAMFGGHSLGRLGNRFALPLALRAGNRFSGWVKEFQRSLGLPRTGLVDVDREMRAERWPIRYGYSPAVLPRPADWHDGIDVVGYWWARRGDDWQPPSDLEDFLTAGERPVLVSLGSMAPGEGDRLAETVVAALRHARVRGVVQAGWSGLHAAASDDIFATGDVPHDWLFPRVAAVVHHAGAGTAAAALRAGAPAVSLPVGFDQPFWARRLTKIGVSPGWLPLKDLEARRVGELIRQAVTDPSYRTRAETLAEVITAERGAKRVAEDIARLADG